MAQLFIMFYHRLKIQTRPAHKTHISPIFKDNSNTSIIFPYFSRTTPLFSWPIDVLPGAGALLWLRHGRLVVDRRIEPGLPGQDGVPVLLLTSNLAGLVGAKL